jgi:hypothetical protein
MRHDTVPSCGAVTTSSTATTTMATAKRRTPQRTKFAGENRTVPTGLI